MASPLGPVRLAMRLPSRVAVAYLLPGRRAAAAGHLRSASLLCVIGEAHPNA